MKIFFGVLLAALFLILPVNSSAYYLGTESMHIKGSESYWMKDTSDNSYHRYAIDYDIVGENPYGEITEVFCVENAPLVEDSTYDFYTIDDSLKQYIHEKDSAYSEEYASGWLESLQAATWYANWFVNQEDSVLNRKIAQVAIWNALGFVDYTTVSESRAVTHLIANGRQNGPRVYTAYAENNLIGDLIKDYESAVTEGSGADFISNWALAVSPSNGGRPIQMGEKGQNFLVQVSETPGTYQILPIPEPTTMLLFGFGLLGLARVSRKKL